MFGCGKNICAIYDLDINGIVFKQALLSFLFYISVYRTNKWGHAALGNQKKNCDDNSMKNFHDNKHLFYLKIISYTCGESIAYTDGKRRACQHKAFILI